MTRERYESLQLKDLHDIAKARNMKGTSAMRKAQLIDAMLEQDRRDAIVANEARKAQQAAAVKEAGAKTQTAGGQQDIQKEDAKETSREASAEVSDKVSAQNRGARTQEHRHRRPQPQREKAQTAENRGEDSHSEKNESAQNQGKGRSRRYTRHGQGNEAANVRRNPEGQKTQRENRDNRETRENRDAREIAPEKKAEIKPETKRTENGSMQTAQAPSAVSVNPPAQTLPAAPARQTSVRGTARPDAPILHKDELIPDLDSGQMANGILEVLPDGYGFIRCANYLPGDNDVYVAPSQIRRFNLKTGDFIRGNIRVRNPGEKFSALLFVKTINDLPPEEATKRYNFEDMTPIFPDEKIRLEKPGASLAMRIMDLLCPIGKGQRGMIVSPPKAGKTTLLKEVAKSVKANNPEIHLIILLIDERPEEVTDIKEAIQGPNIEVIYSTFDETPEHHKRVSEMVIERARRLVEHKQDVMILLDSITRLTRAYNLTEPSSGRTLSGGLDPAALHMPKRFFGAARNMREGGSLTILATALIETGSKMDDVVYEEFKGTGNMEMVLDRKLSERRIFPAIDIVKSGTRRDDLLLTPDELEAINLVRRALNGMKADDAVDRVIDLFARTRTNGEFVNMVKKINWSF